jgi:hypothetical protein
VSKARRPVIAMPTPSDTPVTRISAASQVVLWDQADDADDHGGEQEQERLQRALRKPAHGDDALDVDRHRDEDQAGQRGCRSGGGDEQLVPLRGVVQRHSA